MSQSSVSSSKSSDSNENGDKDIQLLAKTTQQEQRTRNDIDLDAGERQHVRVRTRWWQIWVPRKPPPPPRKSLDDAPLIPIVHASLWSKLTYSWITPIMVLGYQRTLQAPDLWRVDQTHEAGFLSAKLDESWVKRVQHAEEYNRRLESGEIKPSLFRRVLWDIRSIAAGSHYSERRAQLHQAWRDVDGRKEASLAWALNDVFAHLFWIGGVFKVFGDVVQLMGPILIKAIINFAKERASAREQGEPLPNIGRGIAMAIGLFFIVIVTSMLQHQFFWRSMTTGVLARAALINSIYKRSIALTVKSRTKFSNAALINHVSTDVSRIDAASQWFHAGWTAPVQILVCLIILVVQLGPSALAGFLLFIVLAPIQEHVMARRLQIRTKMVKFTDERAHILMEVLGSMRIVKYFCYEVPFLKRIFDTRKAELHGMRQMHFAQSAVVALAYSTPVLAATLAFVTYTSTNDNFDEAIIFASFSLFQLLRQPMMFLPRALSVTVDARNALQRLTELFHADVVTEAAFTIHSDQNEGLKVEEATFEWEKIHSTDGEKTYTSDSPFRMEGINLKVARGSLIAISGPVGSGKSSLLQGLIGEMRKVSGTINFGGRMAYGSQIAWIQNATVRDNVIFGQPFDEDRYWKVMEQACLIPDLQLLPDGDLTEIGEKGINLSGGQKQRINIARALYFDADVILLDDPLSAVDAHVGKSLFHGAILPLARSGKTVILVTHAQHFLCHCDYIYTLQGGRIAEEGTYEQLIARGGEFARLDQEFGGHIEEVEPDSKRPGMHNVGIEQVKSKSGNPRAAGIGRLEGKLIRKETRTTGSVSWIVYRSYLKAGRGLLVAPVAILTFILMQGSQITNAYTLVWWRTDAFNFPWSYYQILYAGLGITQSIFTFLLGSVVDIVSVFVSRNMHHDGIRNMFYAPMAFFDTTPTGRIIGVFGKDIDSIDNQLPMAMRLFVLTLANVSGSIVIVTVLEHYFIVVAAFVFVGYAYFGSFYRQSAREVKRLDSMLRSLLYSHFSESLTGLPTIRSYGEVSRFIADNKYYIDLEDRALLLTVTNQRWLAVRVDSLGAILVFSVALFAVVGVSGINPSQTGLVLTYMTTLVQLCGMFTRQSAEVENYMNAVERLTHYSSLENIDQEAPHEIEATKPSNQWPSEGHISFSNVSLSYRPGLPNVLHGLTLDIKPGEKIGIVGRTGAGKSSLALSLLRIVEFSGQIVIDGVDISKIGLRDLRSHLAIIPQDPTLFSGTVRTALDPFSIYDDARLWDALRRSFLVDATADSSCTAVEKTGSTSSRITLETALEAEGANLSVGERSLLSLARALVKDSKIVILDEATASVDLETDRKIQDTIQTQFSDRTLLCIAHRLRTILSYDRILVLDSGHIAEFDTPLALFNNEHGIFRKLCEGSNIDAEEVQKASICKC